MEEDDFTIADLGSLRGHADGAPGAFLPSTGTQNFAVHDGFSLTLNVQFPYFSFHSPGKLGQKLMDRGASPARAALSTREAILKRASMRAHPRPGRYQRRLRATSAMRPEARPARA